MCLGASNVIFKNKKKKCFLFCRPGFLRLCQARRGGLCDCPLCRPEHGHEPAESQIVGAQACCGGTPGRTLLLFCLPWYRLKGTFSVPPRHPRDRVQGRSDRGQPRQGHQHNRPAQAGRRPSQWWVEGVHIRVIRSHRCRGRRGQCFGASGSSPPCTSAGEGRFQRKSQRELIGSFIRRREEQGGQGQAGGRGEGQEGRRS